MRLTLKLTIALTIILIGQFCLYGYLVAQRLTGFFERDMKQDALHIGRTLAVAVSRSWKNQGQEQALALVGETNDENVDMTIRMVKVGANVEPAQRPDLPPETLDPLRDGKYVVKHAYPAPNDDFIYTYIRVPVESSDLYAIELRQSFDPEHAFTRVSIIRVGVFLLIVVISTGLVMWCLGLLFIAQPIEQLCEKTRQIGRGDFGGSLPVKSNDEIGTLAREINSMNDRLRSTQALLEQETAAKDLTLEQLRHTDRLRTIGTLASGVAHELGTPLNVASGHLSLMLAEKSDPTAIERACSAVSEQLDKMTGIVSNLLSFSRRRTPQKRSSDLDATLGKTIKMLIPFAAKRNIDIDYVKSTTSAIADVDEGQMEQVFMNLLVNAIQAMDSGLIKVNLTSEITRNPELVDDLPSPHICISVRDQGMGMSEDAIAQIFDPFFTTKAPGQGTGMGLSIAHGIMREHGGWITVTSTPGKGSCFLVFVPIGEIQ